MKAVLAVFSGALWISAAGLAQAAPSFAEEAGVRVSSGTPQWIIGSTAPYRMYFIRDNFHVLSATSTDQLDWTVETGVRLSTSAGASLDQSSITACALMEFSTYYRMIYSAVSTVGTFHILSATSTDGLAWFKEPGVRRQADPATVFAGFPRVLRSSSGLWRMYFVQGDTAANYEVLSASSSDDGLTWVLDSGTRAAAAHAAAIAVSTRTDGNVRLMVFEPVSGSTSASKVSSSLSSSGLAFASESGTRFSTSVSSGLPQALVVVRSTDTFRWRLFYGFASSGSTTPFIRSALTESPDLTSISPVRGLDTQSAFSFTLSGEIFGSTPTAKLTKSGQTDVSASGMTSVSDQEVQGTLDLAGLANGFWNVVLTNPDGKSSTLSNAFFVDFPEGNVSVLDNLFRPKKGGSVSLTIQTFHSGNVRVVAYTTTGEKVKVIHDQDVPQGTLSLTWNGTTSLGNFVASGVYLIHVRGPKVSKTEKVVVIK